MKIGDKVKCIEPRMDGDVVGVIAKERTMPDGTPGFIIEVTHHNGIPVDAAINPFFGPFAEEHFHVLSE